MKTAADLFVEMFGGGLKSTPEQADVARYPVRIEVPKGPITGTARGATRGCWWSTWRAG